MKFFLPLLFSSLALSVCLSEDSYKTLFDGKTFNGWKSASSKTSGDYGPFSVNREEKAIHVYAGLKQGSEQEFDCLNTEQSFSHFILKLEYKWLENRFAPRADWDRDAGLLFHVHGDLTKVWPLSVEMQIGETPAHEFRDKRFHTGELFILGKNLRARFKQKDRIWDPENGEWTKDRHAMTRLGVEKPKGEWNELEIRVHGSKKATFLLNNEVVFEIYDIEQEVDGVWIPLREGRIGLQAEWAELMYRNIRIKELPES